jgi:hypothetical protein
LAIICLVGLMRSVLIFKMRNKTFRLWQKAKKIKKRLKMLRQERHVDDYEEILLVKEPNRLAKYNLKCGCRTCSYKEPAIFQEKKHESYREINQEELE